MRNLKKLFAVLVVVAMMVTIMVPAFAATDPAAVSAGISDSDVQKAVERLAAFGIVSGMDDGQYHPEMDVTRAQLAKLAVEALGMGSAAVQGATQFSDVPASHWASGYVNVAAGAGLVKGVGDGKFDPDAKVTYAQAVTLLVRALGYTDSFLKGVWPGNYMAKAGELRITRGVSLAANGSANRGSVAIMLNNALDCHPVIQTTYGTDNNYSEKTNTTLLQQSRDVTLIENATITAVPNMDKGLKSDEVRYTSSDGNDKAALASWMNPDNYLSRVVDLYKDNKGDKDILYIDDSTDTTDVVVGQIVDTNTTDVKFKVRDEAGTETECNVATDAYMVINNGTREVMRFSNVHLKKGLYGTFLKNSAGEWSFGTLYDFNAFDGNGPTIVKEVNTTSNYVKGFYGSNSNHKIDLAAKDGFKVFRGSKEISLSDVKVDDLMYYAEAKEAGDKTFIYAFVAGKVVTGKLSTAKDDGIKIDSTSYDTDGLTGFGCFYSKDADKNMAPYSGAGAANNIKDAVGTTVTAYLDIIGKVRYISTSANATSDDLYGVVTKDNQINMDTLKVYTKDGSSVTYNLTDDIDVSVYGVYKGDVVTYSLNKNGEIDTSDGYAPDLTKVAYFDKNGATHIVKPVTGESYGGQVTALDKDDNYITVSGNSYYVDSSTVLMSYFKSSITHVNTTATASDIDPALVSWDNIKGGSVGTAMYAIVVAGDDHVTAKYVLFTEGFDLTTDAHYGYVTGNKYRDADGWKLDVQLADGTIKTYGVTDDLSDLINQGTVDKYNYIKEKSFIAFKPNSDGDLDKNYVAAVVYGNYGVINTVAGVTSLTGYSTVGSLGNYVTDFTGDSIKLSDTGYYRLASDVAVFVAKNDTHVCFDSVKAGSTGDIDEGNTHIDARLMVNDKGLVKMIVLIKN